jgi:hypothetical protein
VLADGRGAAIADLAAPLTVTYARNGRPEVTGLELSHDEEFAGVILDALAGGVPQLRGFRDGVLRFSGELASGDELAEEASTLKPVFRGAFSRLLPEGANGARYTAAVRTFPFNDQGDIAWTLIDEANADDPTGIVEGTIEPSVFRTRSYEHKAVGEAIVELSQVEGGFDFEVEPLDPTVNAGALGAFNVYRKQGVDRPEVVFGYGPGTLGNCLSARRTTTLPVNRVRVLGVNGVPPVEVSHPGSIAVYGERMLIVNASDVSESATLVAKANAALRPFPVQVVGFTPDPALAPQPWDDYWLGDSVRAHIARGSFRADLAPRVNTVAVAIDAEGNEESHTLTIDAGV